MRRRARRKPLYPSQNLDSFLDILTNTVGVLMFIGLFVALVASQAGTVVRTPLLSQTNKNPRFFEVRGNRVIFIDDQAVDEQIETFANRLPYCEEPSIPDRIFRQDYDYYLDKIREYNNCVSQQISQWEQFEAKTSHYQVSFYGNSLLYEPLPNQPGESPEQLKQISSEFQTILSGLNPEKHYLAFVVRPDSFAAFRAAREQAWKQGFKVGWEPHQSDRPLLFGSGGRSIGVQ